MKKVLVTGAAGFIGYHLSKRLLEEGYLVVGLDNLNNYYDQNLKMDRLNNLKCKDNFNFFKMDLNDKIELNQLFSNQNFDIVVNLAAQAGVRNSIENPHDYITSNIDGFINILEACRKNDIDHLLYASSSSVYGGNKKIPFSVDDRVDSPVSLYAATKKSNELMAHSYSHLFSIPSTGLRFFTVYGPWGRPDMAYFSFANKILSNKEIYIYNQGNMERDFTYIDDIIDSIIKLIPKAPDRNNKESAPYRIVNIGSGKPISLLSFVEILEKKLNRKAKKILTEMQPGDVEKTYADITELNQLTNFTPKWSFEEGITEFVEWYKSYYMS